MIYKRCGKCGRRLPSGTSCPHCKRDYNAPQGIYKQYHTHRWQELRAAVISRYNGLDLWRLHQHNCVAYAETVHHIVPACDDKSMFYSFDNLIPVSRASHDEIHARYKTDKAGTQAILKKIIEDSRAGR